MNTIKKYLLNRWGYNRLADELHRTSEALEHSRKHSRELQSKLYKAEVDALELARINKHLIQMLRDAEEEKRKRFNQGRKKILIKPTQKQRHQQLRQAPRQKHFNEGRKRFE